MRQEWSKLVRQAREAGRTVQVVGSSHSSTGILETEDTLTLLDKLTGIVAHNSEAREAKVCFVISASSSRTP
jgi:FAD/FMN-containing dehydrogenase